MLEGNICNSKLKRTFLPFANKPVPPGVNRFVHTISESCAVSHVRCKLRIEITVAPQADLLWYDWHLRHLQFFRDLPILIIAPACDLLMAEQKMYAHTHIYTVFPPPPPVSILFRNIRIWAVKSGTIIRCKDEWIIVCYHYYYYYYYRYY
jgi:hypothetical protein